MAQSGVRRRRIVSSWATWSSAWPITNRSEDAADRHLAEASGGRPTLARSSASSVGQPLAQSRRPPSMRANRTRSGQRSVALDQRDPDRVVGDPPERHGLRPVAVDDPLQLAEPERQHLGDVGEHLARAPATPRVRCRTSRPAATARRPSTRGASSASAARAAASRSSSMLSVVMVASVARAA